MHDATVQQRFIQLRSQGWSFARIAKELNVSRQTLIDWSRKFQFEIQNLRAIEFEALAEEALSDRAERIRRLGRQLQEVEAELAKRSVADLSTTRLHSLCGSLRRQVLAETGVSRFSVPIKGMPSEEFHEQAMDWQP